jgi:hypothetical protein
MAYSIGEGVFFGRMILLPTYDHYLGRLVVQLTYVQVKVPPPQLEPTLTPWGLIWGLQHATFLFNSVLEHFFQVASRRKFDIEGLFPKAEMCILGLVSVIRLSTSE